ncbi:MAG: ornithine cyclodeaminase family protein, partial [Candidatus Koribacter versatilis]|nr:ornithine cyclodeaminase family protein [Candidatus Koribacter versatilis]
MTDNLGKELLYLSQSDVASVGLTMAEIIAALERMFREKGEGRVEMPPKIGIHTMPDAFIHAMPASIPAQKAAGMKWV